jgi:hypothetical protein
MNLDKSPEASRSTQSQGIMFAKIVPANLARG